MMARDACRALVALPLLVVACAAWAAEPFPEDLWVGLYRFDLANLLGWGHDINRSQDVRPWVTEDGKRLYMISSLGPPDAPWEVAATRGTPASFYRVTDNARNELAVVPSPAEGKLLLLVEGEKSLELIVAHGSTDQAVVAEGLDAARSQFDWSHDGVYAYYTLPAVSGRGMALYRAAAGGNVTRLRDTIVTLLDEGVIGFDVCRTRDRVGVLLAAEVRVLDEGKAAHRIALERKARDLRLSRDGRLAAWSDGRRIVVADVETGETLIRSSPPAEEPVFDAQPAWSPDGARLVFQREYRRPDVEDRVFQTQLVFLTIADGGEEALPLVDKVRNRIQWASTGDPVVYEEIPIDSLDALPLRAFDPPPLGPAPEDATWRRTNGPYGGGHIAAFAVAPSDDKVAYVNTGEEGYYSTSDGGEHWRRVEVDDPIYRQDFVHLVVDSQDAKTVYGMWHQGIDVFRSADGCSTWRQMPRPLRGPHIDQLVPDPAVSGRLYILANNKSQVATTDNEKWTTLIDFDPGKVKAERLDVDKRNPSLVVLCDVASVVLFSLDGGQTWHKPALPEGEEGIRSLAGDPKDADLVIAMTTSRRVFFSTDFGQTWDVYADPTVPGLWTDEIRAAVAAAFPLLVRDEQGEATRPGGTVRVDTSRRLYEVRDEIVHRSDDGGKTWAPANTGLAPAWAYAVGVVPGMGHTIVVSLDAALLRSRDGGEHWEPTDFERGDGEVVQFVAHPSVPGVLLAADRYARVFRSTDQGGTWRRVLEDKAMGAGGAFTFDADDAGRIVYTTSQGIFESADAGATWRRTASFEPPAWQARTVVASGQEIVVGSMGRRTIFRSRDGGATWRRLDGPMRGHRLIAMGGRPDVPGALDVLTMEERSAVLWVSRDFGDTWEARPLPAGRMKPYVMARNPADPDTIVVGSTGEAWLSRDDGRTWQSLGTFEARRPILQLVFSPGENRLYAVVMRDGVVWTELPKG